MKPSAKRIWVWIIGLGMAMSSLASAAMAQEYSHARIVRLSFVEGQVSVQRPDVQEWAEAPINTPLQEGFKLATGENSFAEVQFENASTVRLGQLSFLEFTQLGLLPSGGKLNHLTLSQGYATFHALMESGDQYQVTTPNGELTPEGKAMFRVDLDQGLERVEVFKGIVDFSGSLGDWELVENQTLQLQPGAETPSNLSEEITKDAWDNWVSEREQNATLTSRSPSPQLYSDNVSDLVYGWNDLSTYGMWSYMPGYGYGWIPTTVPYGWSPYTLGRWCWYPRFGYTWISYEPWGWLPYHYGNWSFMAGVGWAWFPGSFGAWSPGLVTWYSGPDWIGWVPGGRNARTSLNPCATGHHCGAVISTTAFQNGADVNPRVVMPVNPLDGRRIDHPGVQPVGAGLLPGAPVSQPVITRQPGAGATSGIRVTRTVDTVPGARPAAGNVPSGETAGPTLRRTVVTPAPRVTAPRATIVYDSSSRRYVNNPTEPVAPATPSVAPTSVTGSSTNTRVMPRVPSGAAPRIAPDVTQNTGAMEHPASAPVAARPSATVPAQPGRQVATPRGSSSRDVGRPEPAPSRVGQAPAPRMSSGEGTSRSGGDWVRGGGQAPATGGGMVRGGSAPSAPAAGGEMVRGGSAPSAPPSGAARR